IGVLVLGRRSKGLHFRREEIEMLSLFAPQIATAFENIRLFESATYEGLTGLLRRESILDLLEREIDRASRHGRPLVVGMADLDFFKAVNDRFGHLAGDAVLKKVAEELSAGLRVTDAVGRYGGEEFLLVFPETNLEGGAQVAEKLRRRIEKLSLPLEDGGTVDPRVSIGLAELPRAGRRRAELSRFLIDAADRALYRAKEGGRNRVETHAPEEIRAGL
ncbi:MAG: sensor domain-containing diguanylate cyclase, partial [Acidobacteriota bacterium]